MRAIIFMFLVIACDAGDSKVTVEEESETIVIDADGDGFIDDDCDDDDALINPGQEEICDGLDNDCDGEIDEDVLTTYYADSDQDGFGNPDIATDSCELPEGFVVTGTDCDDTDDSSFPGAQEVCDGLDNDCDDLVDEDLSETYYRDEDGDGFGDPNQPLEACDLSVGSSIIAEDCDDQNPNINPLASEVCDGIDNNCSGTADENVTTAYYLDQDDDGFGDSDTMVESCEAPEGYVVQDGDCDDLESYTNPQAIEYCDGADNNCDGQVDESGAAGSPLYYTDVDGDGFGEDGTEVLSCEAPANGVLQGGDCDDSNPLVNPAMVEICDGLDNDCDNAVDGSNSVNQSTSYADADGDGFGDASTEQTSCNLPAGNVLQGGDCDDSNASINPAMVEICDGVDNDCDTVVDGLDSIDIAYWYTDGDGDGYGDPATEVASCSQPAGYIGQGEDCDDFNASVNPAMVEVCDGVDNNCDTVVDGLDSIDIAYWYTDGDGDGYGDPATEVASCSQPAGYIGQGEDCDDADAATHPDAVELCDGLDNDCNQVADDGAGGGSSMECAGQSCLEILNAGTSTGDGLYWLDSDGDGDTSNAWLAWCDMTRDGGGWTKMESATYPFYFSDPGWEEYGDAYDENYSMMLALDDFIDGTTYTLRYEVGDSGNWTNAANRAHYSIWTQDHHPAYESTDGSDYVWMEGQESTTCGGFNGFHSAYYDHVVSNGGSPYSILNDVDTTDAPGCWWMQLVPLLDYDGVGYLEGYDGANNHQWQAFWVR